MKEIYFGGDIFLNDYSALMNDKEIDVVEGYFDREDLKTDKILKVSYDENTMSYCRVLWKTLYSIKYIYDENKKTNDYPNHLVIYFSSDSCDEREISEKVQSEYELETYRFVSFSFEKCNEPFVPER